MFQDYVLTMVAILSSNTDLVATMHWIFSRHFLLYFLVVLRPPCDWSVRRFLNHSGALTLKLLVQLDIVHGSNLHHDPICTNGGVRYCGQGFLDLVLFSSSNSLSQSEPSAAFVLELVYYICWALHEMFSFALLWGRTPPSTDECLESNCSAVKRTVQSLWLHITHQLDDQADVTFQHCR